MYLVRFPELSFDEAQTTGPNTRSFFVPFIPGYFTSSFNPVHTVILPSSYTFWQPVFDYTSERSKHLSGELTATLGRYFNGSTHKFLVNARYSPDPHAVVSLSYDINKLSHIGVQTKYNNLISFAGTQLYWNPKLILNGLMEYNSVENSLNYNFKFSGSIILFPSSI